MLKRWAAYLDTRTSESIGLYHTELDAYESMADLFDIELTEAPTTHDARIEYITIKLQPKVTRFYVTEVEVPA